MPDPSAPLKTIALTRIATGFLFLLFGEYKVAGPAFAHAGFQQYLQGYIQGEAVSFTDPFSHTSFFLTPCSLDMRSASSN